MREAGLDTLYIAVEDPSKQTKGIDILLHSWHIVDDTTVGHPGESAALNIWRFITLHS